MSEHFLSRWSRRKVEAKQATEIPTESTADPTDSNQIDHESTLIKQSAEESANLPLPTEEDLAQIEQTGDVTAFLQANVPTALKNQAFKALFKIPQFNHVDMLDVYMEDYNTYVPLPVELRDKMSQVKELLSRPDLEEAESAVVAEENEASTSEAIEATDSQNEVAGDSGIETDSPEDDGQNPKAT